MSAETEFKKALQKLTTTVVDAEAVKGMDEAAFEELRLVALAQRQQLHALHVALLAELAAIHPKARLPHKGWLEKTMARAEALFGPLPTESAAP
jgi:hypothetical protein